MLENNDKWGLREKKEESKIVFRKKIYLMRKKEKLKKKVYVRLE